MVGLELLGCPNPLCVCVRVCVGLTGGKGVLLEGARP